MAIGGVTQSEFNLAVAHPLRRWRAGRCKTARQTGEAGEAFDPILPAFPVEIIAAQRAAEGLTQNGQSLRVNGLRTSVRHLRRNMLDSVDLSRTILFRNRNMNCAHIFGGEYD